MSENKQQASPEQLDIKTPLWYSLVLIALGIAYLSAEFAFNAYLVDTATLSLSQEEIDNLEFYGRSLSGIGLMLLVFGWIKYKSSQKLKTLKKLLIFGLLGFSFMFFGQKALIDNLVDASTADQRKNSQYITLMKQGLVKDAIRIEGVEYNKEEIESPQIKTFLNTVGLLSFVNADFIEVIKNSSKSIIQAMVDSETDIELTKNYSEFDVERNKIFDSWQSYVEANKKLKEATSNTSLADKANEAWSKIEAPINEKWQELERAKGKYNAKTGASSTSENLSSEEKKLRKKAELTRVYLEDFFESYRRCDEEAGNYKEACKKKVLKVYNKNIRLYAGEYIDWKEFCTINPDSKVSLHWEPKYTPKKLLNCPGDQDFIVKKILNNKGGSLDHRATFIEKTGYAPEVTYTEFLLSEKVVVEARQGVKEEGIELSDTWTPYNDNVFKNAVVSKILAKAKTQFSEKTEELAGEPIKPYLKFEEFVSLDIIQDKLKKALNTDDKVDVYMNEKEFFDLVFAPEIEKTVNEQYSKLNADSSLLANGSTDEIGGKQAVKAVVIPPIAMMFSLFFAVLNMVFITLRIIYLFVDVNPKIQAGLSVVFITAIVYLPLQISAGLGANSIASYFVQSASQSIGGASQGLTWLMNFQPIVYPLGKIVGM